MALKDTIKHMRDLLEQITYDLPKAENGNKAASQRVRTSTVKLEKTAKKYRKESIVSERGTKGKKRPAAAKKATTKKAAAKKPAKSTKTKTKSAPKKASGKKSKSKHSARPHALSINRTHLLKRPTAKLARKSAH